MTEQDEVAELLKRKQRLYDQLHADHIAAADQQLKYADNADIASHEAFLTPKALAKYFGWSLAQATYVSTRIHTEPQAFGKVMSAVKPRLAVGYHSVQSPENNAAIMDGVRKTYSGPLALARDLMVINITKKKITVRMASVDEYVLPPDVSQEYKDAPSPNYS